MTAKHIQDAWDKLRAERDELAAWVELMRTALEKSAQWHRGDKWRDSDDEANRDAWQIQMNALDAALAMPNTAAAILRQRDADVARGIATNWLPNVRRRESESSLSKTAHNQAVDDCVKHVLSYVAAKEANHG